MKTDYELIKDFPKVLYCVNYRGEIKEVPVKEAHFVGKFGIEINLGNREYIYDKISDSHKIEYREYMGFGRTNNYAGWYISKNAAEDYAKRQIEDRDRRHKMGDVYEIYCAAARARASITFDFSKR